MIWQFLDTSNQSMIGLVWHKWHKTHNFSQYYHVSKGDYWNVKIWTGHQERLDVSSCTHVTQYLQLYIVTQTCARSTHHHTTQAL